MVRTAYGKRCSGEYKSQGGTVHFASMAERLRADSLELLWKGKLVLSWQHEPRWFELTYYFRGDVRTDTYTPDFRVDWVDDGVIWEEVKRNHLSAKYAAKIKRFCCQCPDDRLRLIWYGSEPHRGPDKRSLDKVRPYLYDLQFERVPR